MNIFGYQETHQPTSTCQACATMHPFGCDACRNEVSRSIKDEQDDDTRPSRLIWVGSGEDFPQGIMT